MEHCDRNHSLDKMSKDIKLAVVVMPGGAVLLFSIPMN